MKSTSRGRAACVPSTLSSQLSSYKNAQGWHFRVYPISRPKPLLLPFPLQISTLKSVRNIVVVSLNLLYCVCIHSPPTLLSCGALPAAATRWQHLRIVLHTLPGPLCRDESRQEANTKPLLPSSLIWVWSSLDKPNSKVALPFVCKGWGRGEGGNISYTFSHTFKTFNTLWKQLLYVYIVFFSLIK